MVPDLSLIVPWFVVFAGVAALAGLLAVTVVTRAVVTHRRTRLARHQGLRSYYRGLAFSH
jgi:hypothetical protein